MPYIGKAPNQGVRNRFIYSATAGQTSFSGSDANAFTLSYSDGADADVYQNGVLLKPSTDYTATSGTSVVLVTGASLNDVIEIIVYDTFSIANSYTKADSDTRFVNVTGDTMTGDLTIGDASASDRKILFDGNAQDFHIGLDDSTDSLTIGLGSTLGTTSHMVIDATGAITKPLQPAFHVSVNSTDSNFAINTFHTATFNTEVFDQNGDFASNTFTAPVTGRYQLNLIAWFEDVASSADYIQVEITTSNTRYFGVIDATGFDRTVTYLTLPVCVLADMDANDTAIVRYYQSGGDVQTDFGTATTFSGYLVA